MPNCISSRQLTKIEKNSPFSFIQTETYMSYDNCNTEIIQEWEEYNLAQPFASIVILSLVIVIFICIFIDWQKKCYDK